MTDYNFVFFIPWLIAAAILLVGFVAIKIISRAVGKALKKTSLDPTLHRFVSNVAIAACWIAVVGMALPVLGVSLSAFLAMLGVAGAAIALALKDSLGNIAGGIIVIITKPFKRGDIIEAGDAAGTVDSIGMLYTTLVTPDNKVVHMPNGKLSTSTIVNFSAESKRRVDCKFGISSASSVPAAKEILTVLAEQSDMVLPDPAPIIGVSGHSDGMVFIDVKVWCNTADVFDVKYFLEENAKLAFDESGIEMQAPHIVVHMKKK